VFIVSGRESPAFARIKEEKKEVRIPIFEVLKTYKRSVLLAMGARMAKMVFLHLRDFVLAYATEQVKLPGKPC